MIILSEVSQTEKDQCHMISLICGIYNMTQMSLSIKQKQTHRHREQTYGCQWGRGGRRGMDWEFGLSRCKLFHLEWTNNKVLMYNTGNYSQYPVIHHKGKESEKEYIYIYVYI